MEKKIKVSLSVYGIISALSFIYLILADSPPGIGIPTFFVIQSAMLYYIGLNNKGWVNLKGLFMLVPMFIIALNNFISANYMMMPTNFLALAFLYSIMFLLLRNNINVMKLKILDVLKTLVNIFEPVINFMVPFKWMAERRQNKDKNILARRILLGIAITVPAVIFLVTMLSQADLVFNNSFMVFNKWLKKLLEEVNIPKIIVGTFAGLYLFGHLYSVFKNEDSLADMISYKNDNLSRFKGDLVVLNILLTSILVIYTIFIAIQFKYLFSGGALPYGLTYSEYARRGFFELVFLSLLNIGLILLTSYLLRDKIYEDKNKWALFTRLMLIYLCLVTGILLVSSYYRMYLYDGAYGFTRLRVLVYIFLFFEALGLIATLTYIIRHNFNIFAVYAALGLAFYLTLNLVRIDEIIAKRNVDMYFSGQAEEIDIDYLLTLSQDTLPQIARLTDSKVQILTRTKALNYLEDIREIYNMREDSWLSYNLSVERNKAILNEIMQP